DQADGMGDAAAPPCRGSTQEELWPPELKPHVKNLSAMCQAGSCLHLCSEPRKLETTGASWLSAERRNREPKPAPGAHNHSGQVEPTLSLLLRKLRNQRPVQL